MIDPMMMRLDLMVDPLAAARETAAARGLPADRTSDGIRAATGGGQPRRVILFLPDSADPAHRIFQDQHWHIALPRTRPTIWKQATTAVLRQALGNVAFPTINTFGGRAGRHTLLLPRGVPTGPEEDPALVARLESAPDPEIERATHRLDAACHHALATLSAHAIIALRRAPAILALEMVGKDPGTPLRIYPVRTFMQ